jgi:hypothetical protein
VDCRALELNRLRVEGPLIKLPGELSMLMVETRESWRKLEVIRLVGDGRLEVLGESSVLSVLTRESRGGPTLAALVGGRNGVSHPALRAIATTLSSRFLDLSACQFRGPAEVSQLLIVLNISL